ncbi:hypothetical protein [Methylobacterium sp. 1973]|uniref:hypothetical protein n=1 Tax=Methylobacterium sp. 1973 TaxID=3156421 RepID=UPI0033938485
MRRHFPISPATGLEDQALLPWTDGNPVTGVEGSYPGNKVVIDTETEVLNAQRTSGQADSSDGTDLAQLIKAISLGVQVNYGAVANVLAVAIQGGVTFSALRPGMKFYGFVQVANTGPVQAAVSGFGAGNGNYPVVRSDGSALAKGDLVVGGFVELRVNSDATGFVCPTAALSVLNVIQSQFLITAPVTKTIALTGTPDFPSPAAAIAWLGKYLITSTGSVTFQCAAGQYVSSATLGWDHPNMNRVTLKGTRTAPAPTTLAVTGFSATNRANDAAMNLTNLRNIFQTELRFTLGTGMTCASPSPTFQDLLITGDGAGTESNGASGLQLTGGGTINNVAIHGFAGAGCRSDAGQTIVSANTSFLISGCGATATGSLGANSGSTLVVAGTVVVAGSGAHGISCLSGTIRRNAGGVINSYGNALNGGNFQSSRYDGGGGAFTYNGGNGVAGYLSTLDLFQTNAGGNGSYGVYADNSPTVARSMTFNPANSSGTMGAVGGAAQVDALGASTNGTETPAVNNTGNRGARISQ